MIRYYTEEILTIAGLSVHIYKHFLYWARIISPQLGSSVYWIK